MSDLNEFLNLIAAGKRTDPKAIKDKELKHHIKEVVKSDLGSLFSEISAIKKEIKEIEAAKPINQQIAKVREHIKDDIDSLFSQLSDLSKTTAIPLPIVVEKAPEPTVEQPEKAPEPTVEQPETQRSSKPTEIDTAKLQFDSNKYLNGNSSKRESPDRVDPNLKSIQDKMKVLEQAIARVVNTGPGSGEVNLRYLDDIDRSSISDGLFLYYDASNKKFKFGNPNSGGSGTSTTISGIATIDFLNGNKTAETIITGIPTITSTSKVFCDMRIEATSTHSTDDMLVDPIRLLIKDLVIGTGFTIYGEMDNAKANGTYNVNWFLI